MSSDFNNQAHRAHQSHLDTHRTHHQMHVDAHRRAQESARHSQEMFGRSRRPDVSAQHSGGGVGRVIAGFFSLLIVLAVLAFIGWIVLSEVLPSLG